MAKEEEEGPGWKRRSLTFYETDPASSPVAPRRDGMLQPSEVKSTQRTNLQEATLLLHPECNTNIPALSQGSQAEPYPSRCKHSLQDTSPMWLVRPMSLSAWTSILTVSLSSFYSAYPWVHHSSTVGHPTLGNLFRKAHPWALHLNKHQNLLCPDGLERFVSNVYRESHIEDQGLYLPHSLPSEFRTASSRVHGTYSTI